MKNNTAIYLTHWKDGSTTYRLDEKLALMFGSKPIAIETGKEVGDEYYIYNFKTKEWEFDCKINPISIRYIVDYYINDEHGFVRYATFTEAKAKADEEYGTVRSIDGQFIYAKKEPSAYDEYWDAL